MAAAVVKEETLESAPIHFKIGRFFRIFGIVATKQQRMIMLKKPN
jgi:hypothetical protein